MDKVTVYKDQYDEWRWRRRSENGSIVADSAEGYTKKSHAVTMATDLNKDCAVVIEPSG